MSEKLRLIGGETFILSEGASVEDGEDTLKNVVLLGPTSNNGNDYTPDAMRSAVPLYEGRAVYVDHDLKARSRKVEERFGDVSNVRFVESDYDGKPRVRGDVRYLRAHPRTAQIVESYRKKLPFFGMSHVGDGLGQKQANGRRLVEQLTRVASLDVVDRAATCHLAEQDDPADPAAAHTEALTQMVVAIMSDPSMDKAAKKKKLEALLDMQDDAGARAPASAGALPPVMNEATLNKVVGNLVEQAVSKALTTALPTLIEQERQRVAAEAKYVKPATQPPHGQPPARGGVNGKVPTDPEERKKWLRQP